ncbi:MAG TPA: hypothetical protein VLJ61_17835 [Pyrinomonadaceae bacterium]|nr:hypothetical protein [Pyrinomonadaceae bacterium]
MRRVGGGLAAVLSALLVCAAGAGLRAQKRTEAEGRDDARRDVHSVTIPVTVRLPEKGPEAEVHYLDDLAVFEDGERQEVLATRGAGRSPMTLAVLIQDDLASSISNEIKGIGDFIRNLPPGSRVMVGYIHSGSLQVRQKFTGDLDHAAKSLRIPLSSSLAAPYSTFSETRDAVKRFESQPVGRRAVLVVSDGIDTSRGIDNAAPPNNVELQRAIEEAQRLGVAVYSIYAPTVGDVNPALVSLGQGSLERFSNETGGRSFFHGTGPPVSLDRFLHDVDTFLSRQFALTYLSTHAGKGFHKVRVVADLGDGDIFYPSGYTR